MSDENITAPTTSDYSPNPQLNYCGTKARVEFKRSYLNQDKIKYNHEKLVNIYIVYEINENFNISSYPTLEKCLFVAVTLTKNTDIDKLNILDTVFDLISIDFFSLPSGATDRNVIIFGVDMSLSTKIDHKKRYFNYW